MAASAFVLLLSSFLLPPAPARTPTPPAKLFRYVAPGAHVAVGVDVGAFGNNLLKELNKLSKKPFIANNRQLARGLQRLESKLLQALKEVEKRFGVDPLKAIEHATFSVLLRKGRPLFLVHLGGRFPAQLEEKLLSQMKISTPPSKLRGFRLYTSTKRRPVGFAWSTKDLLLGDVALLQQTLALSTKQAFRRGTLAGMMLRQHQRRSMISFGLQVPPFAQKKIAREVPSFSWMVGPSIRGFHASLQYKGMTGTVLSAKKRTLQRLRLLFSGMGDIFLAGDHAIRGLIKIADGLLHAKDSSLPPPLAQLAQHKQQLFAFLLKKLGSKPATHRIQMRQKRWVRLQIRGSQLPAILFGTVVLGGGGYFWFRLQRRRRYRRYRRHRRYRRYRRFVPPPSRRSYPPSKR